MGFKLGDKVIHSTYGLGEIVDIQEKEIQGELKSCYVVHVANLHIWVPIDDQRQQTLRVPTLPDEFEKLSVILSSPAEPLPEDRALRKDLLNDRLRDGQLASICGVVRDLTGYQHTKKLNDQESSILDRAVNSLLTEWTFSLGVSLQQARRALDALLGA